VVITITAGLERNSKVMENTVHLWYRYWLELHTVTLHEVTAYLSPLRLADEEKNHADLYPNLAMLSVSHTLHIFSAS